MKRTYIIQHWLLTLLSAPVVSQGIQYIWGTSRHQVVGLLEVYPITLIFSIIFSLPAFSVYLACFYFLSKQNLKTIFSKLILITVSVAGIYITMTIIKGSMSQEIIIAYSVTACIVGVILKLKKSQIRTEGKLIAK